jgi:hypothetical protein
MRCASSATTILTFRQWRSPHFRLHRATRARRFAPELRSCPRTSYGRLDIQTAPGQ